MRSFVVVGLGFGDEGKGGVVDWLTREHGSSLTVRFNGGAQAAHHVVTPEGLEHTFNQFGSGTLAGADTYLSEYVLVNPLALATEAAALMDLGVKEPFKHVYVHQDAPVTTPYHVALNRLRELARGSDRHGSCGLGIAETMIDCLAGKHLRFGELLDDDLPKRLTAIAGEKYGQYIQLPGSANPSSKQWAEGMALRDLAYTLEDTVETMRIVANSVTIVDGLPPADTAVFEGAQGVLLDQHWGFAPYHTWSQTTSSNARRILWGTEGESTVLGVTRAYLTRHGAGPFPTEDPHAIRPDKSNADNDWQGTMRYGWADLVLLRYAAKADANLDGLVVTCLDQLEKGLYSKGYLDHRGPVEMTAESLFRALPDHVKCQVEELPNVLAEAVGVPLYATSNGPMALNKSRVIHTLERGQIELLPN